MIGVKSRHNEPIDYLINRFNKTCNNAGLLTELKKYSFYEKPSEIKNRAKQSLKRKKILDEKSFKTKKRKRSSGI